MQLNRIPSANALSTAFRKEILKELETLEDDETIKVVIITGASNYFSAGFDLNEFASVDSTNVADLIKSADELVCKLSFYKKPTIAAINGPALAGGMDLAIICDIRIASESAIFSGPEIKFIPALYGPYARILGEGMARELILTGKLITAKEALEMGLINKITSPEMLHVEAKKMAQMIAEAPLSVLQTEKKVMQAVQGKFVADSIDFENEIFHEILLDKTHRQEFKNNVKAYLQKIKKN
ncbi:MAG: enoyl-CoA hydratase/carnithine racemase [Promethearchaeota archaeon CR_4]|nr:MAG: enoyl-CoA hydratase/carnithine racemase [Candidatus Lokiarchaeota archaeon CR_4]